MTPWTEAELQQLYTELGTRFNADVWGKGDADQLVPLLHEKRKDQKRTATTNTTCKAQ